MGKYLTVQQHFVEQQRKFPQATGDLTGLLWDLSTAFKIIGRAVNKAGIANVLGTEGETNASGDSVVKLDRFAQDTLVSALSRGGHVCCMASEESEELISIPKGLTKGKYVVVFDPLDGSSNVDANVSIGTIFGIYRPRSSACEGTLEDVLQPGSALVAAGYVVYGSSTMLVYTTGNGVNGFTLDPSIGEFLLSHPEIRMPEKGKIYSINEGNFTRWDEPTQRYISYLKSDQAGPYSLRYIGSMVADVHRTLLYGGIFLYPAISAGPGQPAKGKLRLLYEGAPMAKIIEQAGGLAIAEHRRILDIQPTSLHQKIPLAVGSREDVREYQRYLNKESGQKLGTSVHVA